MQKRNLKDATPAEKRSAIEELLKEHPKMSGEKIAELTGLPPATVQTSLQKIAAKAKPESRFTTEKELEDWLRKHSLEVFGEEIRWIDALKHLPGESGHDIVTGLVGEDAKSNTVIVVVKLLRPKSDRKYDLACESVGQVLHYAYASIYALVNPVQREVGIDPSDAALRTVSDYFLRLFIVGEEFSQPLENMCRLLRAYGINICHRFVGSST